MVSPPGPGNIRAGAKPERRDAGSKVMAPEPALNLGPDRDADLVARIGAGDRDGAFEILVERFESRVYRLCHSLLRDPHAAQDAAQETFLRVWRALGRFDPGSASLSTWIYAIARNRCLSVLGRTRLETDSLDEPGVGERALEVAAPGAPVDGDSGALLRRMVDALPEAQRCALQLYYYEDRAVDEVAAMLGLPRNTVKTHLHRARANLLERMVAQGLGGPAHWLGLQEGGR